MQYKRLSWSIESSPQKPGDNAIGILTLNDPKASNAVGPRMALELDAMIDEIRHSEVRVVVITGAGGIFCGGGNLKVETLPMEKPDDRLGLDDNEYGDLLLWWLNDHFHHLAQRACRKLEDLPQTTIAAMDGITVGVGLEMAISCDLRLCSDRVKMAELAIPAGFMSEWGAPRNLPKLIGLTRATELILTGRFVEAKEAVEIGLVNRAVAPERLMAEARDMAGRIAQMPKLGVRYAKEMLRHYNQHNRSQEGLDAEMARVLEITRTRECAEGIAAFNERRRPQWMENLR